MSGSSGPSTNTGNPADLGIVNTNINCAPGVKLSDKQKVVVGSILDLFAGKPSLKKLGLWEDTAKFQDNITLAEGRKQYAAQWYGLKAAFSEIERLHLEVSFFFFVCFFFFLISWFREVGWGKGLIFLFMKKIEQKGRKRYY